MNKRQAAVLMFGAICLLTVPGCIISHCERRGVTGRLVDAASEQVTGAVPVAVTVDNHQVKIVASPDGCFDVKPRYTLVLWVGGDYAWPPPTVEVIAEGYEPFRTAITEQQPLQEGDYVHLGNLHLRKKSQEIIPK